MSTRHRERGTALFAVVVYLGIVSILTGAFYNAIHRTLAETIRAERYEAALCLAEAGAEKALAALQNPARAYLGETATPLGDGTFTVVVEPAADRPEAYRIVSTGALGDADAPLARARVVVEAVVAGGRVSDLRRNEEAVR